METEPHTGTKTPQKSEGISEDTHVDTSKIAEEEQHVPTQAETKIVVEVVDARVEVVRHRKHERTMARTLRWPIHSNTPRVTF